MRSGPSNPILASVRRVEEDDRTFPQSDQDLLAAFTSRRDPVAFDALLRRHGPMVLDVCRCLLFNEADVEDAFQATFLILTRSARSVRDGGALARPPRPWAGDRLAGCFAANGRRREAPGLGPGIVRLVATPPTDVCNDEAFGLG